MDEVRAQTQRAASEASRTVRETTNEAARVFTRAADNGAQTTAALAEANQRVMNEFLTLSMQTFEETARLWIEAQQSVMQIMRENAAAAMRAQIAWPEVFADPLRWYHSVCRESIDGTRKAFELVNGTSEALTESVGRLQASTEQAGSKIEGALTTAASRMRDAA